MKGGLHLGFRMCSFARVLLDAARAADSSEDEDNVAQIVYKLAEGLPLRDGSLHCTERRFQIEEFA